MNNYLKYNLILLVIAAIGLAVFFFVVRSEESNEHVHVAESYTCPMHPEIIRDAPDQCPICGMDLVKIVSDHPAVVDDGIDHLLKPTDQFIVGDFLTTSAKDTAISMEIALSGTVAFDPNTAVNISARISGRIEKLYVNYTYQKITKGQKLFDLYSPELLTAQENFVYLILHDVDNAPIIQAAKQNLRQFGMTESQVNYLATAKKVNPQMTIYSPVNGIIVGTKAMDAANTPQMSASTTTQDLNVKEGSYITVGEVVLQILNTDKIWGIFNVTAGNYSLIQVNQPIAITTEWDEKQVIQAQINFVETQLNPTEKTNRIRVFIDNHTLKLPIGMRLQGKVKTNPILGIWIPKTAFVSLGTSKVVFVKMNNGFKAVAIHVGLEMDDYVQILQGITSKEIIAQQAQYLVDSESFIKLEQF